MDRHSGSVGDGRGKQCGLGSSAAEMNPTVENVAGKLRRAARERFADSGRRFSNKARPQAPELRRWKVQGFRQSGRKIRAADVYAPVPGLCPERIGQGEFELLGGAGPHLKTMGEMKLIDDR